MAFSLMTKFQRVLLYNQPTTMLSGAHAQINKTGNDGLRRHIKFSTVALHALFCVCAEKDFSCIVIGLKRTLTLECFKSRNALNQEMLKT